MAELVPIQFAGMTNRARSPAVNMDRLVNWYLEKNPEGSKGVVSLYPTPGLKSWDTMGSGPIRGMHVMGSSLFVVSGNSLYHATTSSNASIVGNIARDGNVHMVDNGTYVMIVTSVEVYAATSSTITTYAQQNMTSATYQDGYGITTKADSQAFYITGLDASFNTMAALDTSNADSQPGKVLAAISDHRELWLFKERTTEIWYNSGNALFPFTRTPQGFIEHGCAAGGSVAKAENTVFWLGDDLYVWAATGYQPQKISDDDIDTRLKDVNDPSSGSGWTYSQGGRTFYVLTFTDLTVVYDLRTGKWHERKTTDESRWRANNYARLGSTHLVGDFENGNVYELDLDTYTDNGVAILREATAPVLHGGGRRMFLSELFVDIESGVGLESGDGSDPVIALEMSDDGGKTFGNQISATMGKVGEYNDRAKFQRLGSFYQRTLKVTVSDPVKAIIIGAYARIEAGL